MNKYHHTKNQLGNKSEAYTTDETAEGWTYGQALHCTQTWTIINVLISKTGGTVIEIQ